jgi:hypothetical protein
MNPNLTNTERDEQPSLPDQQQSSFDGSPTTDSDSKTVVIAGERNDVIEVTKVVIKFVPKLRIPSQLTVIRHEQRYYGPELLLHSETDGRDENYLLTAPGPTSQLRLWVANTTDDRQRSGWTAAADIQAVLSAEQPPYEQCSQCGQQIRTIEYERMSALGRCQQE